MKIAVAADHAGFSLKQEVTQWVKQLGYEVLDVGAHEYDATDDYPDFARYLGQAIQAGQAERGILCCGSGVGACVAANKLTGIRAGMCHDVYSARQGVEHDDMNVLCLGGRIVGLALAEELVKAFVGARFSGDERHLRRLEKVKAIEAGSRKG